METSVAIAIAVLILVLLVFGVKQISAAPKLPGSYYQGQVPLQVAGGGCGV